MIQAVNAALLELQSAALARTLYPAGHPRIRASEEKSLVLLGDIFSHRPEFTVFVVDDRVIFGEELLPSSPSLVNTLFGLLREKGVDHITLRRGLDLPELVAFLNELSASDEHPPAPLQPSAHIGFGAILRKSTPSLAPFVSVDRIAEASPRYTPAAVEGVWNGIQDSHRLEIDTLGDVVSTLSHSISESSCAILPLAFVKGYDEYTFVHIINVGILTMALGESLGFDSRMTHELGVAALLHDVGKMAVPLEVLNKNGRYTEEEYRAMQVHPVEGARMLLRTRGVPDLAAVVAYEHHVRYDGGGYPKVPPGWRLNLASRICQIADVYDALRTDRPYRAGMPIEKITKIMRGDAGTYFDPELLAIFLDHVVPRAVVQDPVSGKAADSPASPPLAVARGESGTATESR